MSEQQVEKPIRPVYDVEPNSGIDLEKPLSEQKPEESKLSKFAQKVTEQFEEKQKEKQPNVEIPKSERVVKTESTKQRAIPSVTATEEIFEPELPQQLQGIEGGKIDLRPLQSIAPMRGSVSGLEEIPHPSLNTIQRQIAQLANANRLPSLWGMSDEERNASEIVASRIVELGRSAKQISPDLNVRAFISNAQGVDGSRDAEAYLTAIEDEIYGTALKNELYETHDNTRGSSIADNEIHESFEALDHPVTKFENKAGLEFTREETAYGDNYAQYKEPEDEFEKDKHFDIMSGTFTSDTKKSKSERLEKRLANANRKLEMMRLRNAVKNAEETARELNA